MKLTPLFGQYEGTASIKTVALIGEDDGGGATKTTSVTYEHVDFNEMKLNYATASYFYRTIGEFNIHGFVDPVQVDESWSLRWQDLVQCYIETGTNAYAFLGFISAFTDDDPDSITGVGWRRNSSGLWTSFIRDTVRQYEPIRTLREFAYSDLATSNINHIGVILDGQTRTIYWIANGEIKDFFTPDEGLGAFADIGAFQYRLIVDNADIRLRTYGGGDSHILSLGELQDEDVSSLSTPTVTVGGVTAYGADFAGSAFLHSPGDSFHLASRWQVSLDTDPTFASPGIDGWSCVNLTGLLVDGLDEDSGYIVRVRYIAEDGTMSDWSASASFTTLVDDTNGSPGPPDGGYSDTCPGIEHPTSWSSCD